MVGRSDSHHFPVYSPATPPRLCWTSSDKEYMSDMDDAAPEAASGIRSEKGASKRVTFLVGKKEIMKMHFRSDKGDRDRKAGNH